MGGQNVLQLAGEQFGRLTVLRYAGSNRWRVSMWLCLCECGNKVTVPARNLRDGRTRSCGCGRRDWYRALGRTYGGKRS